MRGNGLLQALLFSSALWPAWLCITSRARMKGTAHNKAAGWPALSRSDQQRCDRSSATAGTTVQPDKPAGAAFFQRGHRVVIATQQDQLALGIMQAHHQLVVQFPRITGRRTGVENVTGQQYRIHRLLLHLLQQPVDQRLMLGLPATAHEMLAQMPVRSVKNAHAIAQRENSAF
jgi:hypothetical protein